jgi:SAM-dependent methyltransferase
MSEHQHVGGSDAWLTAAWSLVLRWLPPAPARVVEVGCGSLGGFVPRLRSAGYDAIGVDPDAPDGAEYVRSEFELVEPSGDADVVVASTSLHHVADPRQVIDRIGRTVLPAGTVIVIEWSWERFDQATAEWCFQRLGPRGNGGWLHRHRDRWMASGHAWADYLRAWAGEEHIHPAGPLLDLLQERFQVRHIGQGPYFFPDLHETTEADEAAAIRTGEIQATRVDFVGALPPAP